MLDFCLQTNVTEMPYLLLAHDAPLLVPLPVDADCLALETKIRCYMILVKLVFCAILIINTTLIQYLHDLEK